MVDILDIYNTYVGIHIGRDSFICEGLVVRTFLLPHFLNRVVLGGVRALMNIFQVQFSSFGSFNVKTVLLRLHEVLGLLKGLTEVVSFRLLHPRVHVRSYHYSFLITSIVRSNLYFRASLCGRRYAGRSFCERVDLLLTEAIQLIEFGLDNRRIG